MATIISLLGSKGGCGKTTLSHMLCYGLGLLDRKAAFVMTDGGRLPPASGSLPYVFADGRNASARGKMLVALQDRPDWFAIIDGGANQVAIDSELYQHSDLVLLPFRDSHEDLRVVCRDMERLPKALAMPSQWPTNPWQFKASQNLLESFPKALRQRVLAPVFAISASKLLLQDEPPENPPTALNNACRALARYMQGVMEHGHDAIPENQTALGATRRIQRLVASREAQGAPAAG